MFTNAATLTILFYGAGGGAATLNAITVATYPVYRVYVKVLAILSVGEKNVLTESIACLFPVVAPSEKRAQPAKRTSGLRTPICTFSRVGLVVICTSTLNVRAGSANVPPCPDPSAVAMILASGGGEYG